jgi:uncharacterized membrane protein
LALDEKRLSEFKERIKALKDKATQTPETPYAILDTLQADAYNILHKQAILDGLIQDQEERKKYAQLIYWMIVGWLIVILTMLFFYGFKLMSFSDAVLITLITTTTANITVFFLGVVRYLFPNKPAEIETSPD